MKLIIEKWPFFYLHVSSRFLGKQAQKVIHLTNWLSPRDSKKPFLILLP